MQEKGGKIPATLTVLTKNSAKTLEKALESSKDFDDIIVCDGGSTDATLDIAKKYGARVIAQDSSFLENGKIFDYAGVRNQTFDAAKHNWIFWLDSDEYASEELIAAIREIVTERGEGGGGAFWVNRKYVIDGRVIDCAATYPNRQMRFFAKRSSEKFVKRIHERIKLKDDVRHEFIDEVTYIPFEADVEKIRSKWDYQIAVAAAQASPLSLWNFFVGLFDTAKVSLLWFARLAYNTLFCSGNKMPFKFEMERHRFHLKLLAALWGEVYVGKKRVADWFSFTDACLFVLGLLITIVAATYRLTEAPGIWYDEGYLSQVAMNVAEHGAQVLQIAPGKFISSATVSSGFTLYYPVALFYKLFGVGVLQGRAMMAIYIIALWFAGYFFIRRLFGSRTAGWTGLLLATLPLIYGNGKSVLGEVPGLFFLIATFIALHRLAHSQYKNNLLCAIAGIIGGLCIVTKPIFILLLPAVLFAYLLRFRRIHISVSGFCIGFACLMVPILLWLHLQFGPSDTWQIVLNYYFNPYGDDSYVNVTQGLLRFVTDTTSLYTIILLAAWAIALYARKGLKMVQDVEVAAFIFTLLVLIASVRLPSWNRYIFPGTVLVVMFAPAVLHEAFAYFRARLTVLSKVQWLPTLVVVALLALQGYQLVHGSFVASYYGSHKTANLQKAFAQLDSNATFFVYNVPTIVILLPNRDYYQFIMPHPTATSFGADVVGAENLPLISQHMPKYVLVSNDYFQAHKDTFAGYALRSTISGLAILEKP